MPIQRVPLPDFDFGITSLLGDDGQSIVYTVFNENGPAVGDNEARVERYDLAGGTTTPIVAAEATFDFSLSDATPNGATIALDTAAKLVPEDDNSSAQTGRADVYTLDAATGDFTLESVAPDGTSSEFGGSGGRLSADGRFLVFNGFSDDLTPNDTNGVADIYLRDRTTGETVNLTQARDAQTANLFPDIAGLSDDGGTVLVRAYDADDPFTGANENEDFYVLDVASRDLTRLDVDFDGGLGALTADGGQAFINTGETRSDIVRVDLATGAQESVVDGQEPVFRFAVSADGRYLAVETDAALDPNDADGAQDLYVLDLAADRTFLVDQGDPDNFNRTIGVDDIATSADNPDVPIFTAVTSEALTPDDTNDGLDLYAVSLDLLAVDDAASVNEGGTVRIDVLANDVDADGNGIDLAGFTPEPTAAIAIDDNGTPGDASDDALLLTPGDGFEDGTEIGYTITDDAGATSDATVTVALLAGGDAGDELIVTTTNDVIAQDGELSLREAVRAANAREGADTITFADDLKGATLLLDGGPLTISDDLTIDGDTLDGGVAGVTLTEFVPTYTSGGGTYTRGFIAVESGVRAGFEDLTITQDGNAAFDEAAGTKLFGAGADISLDRVLLGDIAIRYGATAVRVQGGSLSVADSIIENIRGSDGVGNGIEATDGASVSIARTALSDIGGTYYGFAVDVEGTLDLQDSAITGVFGRYGGFGVRVDGTLDVANVTVSDVRGPGGYDTGPGGGAGVSILTGGSGTITNATIAGNVVGAGIEVADGAEVRLENSLVAENYQSQNLDPTGRDTPIGNEENLILKDVVGTIESNGGNVFTQDAVEGAAGGDALGADPREVFTDFETVAYQGFPGEVDPVVLPAAADNGGPTPTVALLDDPANPAIGQAVAADAPATDQRGFARDADPDAGSFEAGADGAPPPPAESLNVDVTFLAEDADFANTLGYYVRDAAGNLTGEAGILFPEVGDDVLEAGATASVAGDFPFPNGVGFFLIRDGADLGLDFDDGSVRVEDEKLVFEAADGVETKLQDYRVHFDFEDGQLQTSGGDDGAPTRYAWEDKASSEGSYDGDFDDAVFDVVVSITIPAPVLPTDPPFGA